MAFNGTRNFEKSELLDYLQGIGMRFGPTSTPTRASTRPSTCWRCRPTIRRFSIPALLVLEDWASGVSLEDEEIEKERGVVVEEWRGGRGAGARLRDAEIPYRFHGSRYAERLPIGDPEMLREAPPERLRDFYRDWYRPDLMAVIAVGDFEAEEVESEIRSRFGKLEGPETPRERFEAEIPPHEETLVSVFSDPELPRSSVSVAYKGPPDPYVTVADYRAPAGERSLQRDAEQPAGRARRRGRPAVHRRLQRQGNAGPHPQPLRALGRRPRRRRGAGAGSPADRVGACSQARLRGERTGTGQGQHAAVAGSGLRRAGQDPFGGLCRRVLAQLPERRAFPGIAYERELARRYLPELELAEVNAVADSWIHDNDRVVLASGPEKDGLEQPGEEELLAALGRVGQVEVAAYEDDVGEGALVPVRPSPGRIVERSTIEELGVTEWRLSNGVRVVLRPSDFKNDEILVASFSGGRLTRLGRGLLEANMATSVVQLSGLGNFSLTQLNKALAGKVARVGPVIGPSSKASAAGVRPRTWKPCSS